ncbi:C40 family peptidase [Poseidonibacter lekithochrous]|uniref:NlpC/P60 family protein n=1 Tax=Poseidonibacter TaxID=2321187 RepID=UPI001C09B7E8|nr:MULTISPECIES: NlpC/P60 family protein [Poseidonibacter]MBU3014541.1 C40 family peptidase [Poseidonibacter lekithochrous]MDO6827839.1 NlpC/P60 family protein [Poseidonibacter sp. 1_MG-2023]
MKTQKIILFALFIYLFIGCSKKNTELSPTNLPYPSASLQKTILQNKRKKDSINKNFTNFYSEWKGVKYKYGGNSKKGIDCSAFIQKAFKKTLSIKIPRTTLQQSKKGKSIKKSQLKLGDLVFFKTGRNSRHVGIYLEKGKFMHASTKKGVTISKLDNTYFHKHYWKSQRILD